MTELRTKYHIIESGNGGYQYKENQMIDKDVLVSIHNAGFFSCSSIALEDLMVYYNIHGKLPDEFKRDAQYMHYKSQAADNLIPVLFAETDSEIRFTAPVEITSDKVWFQWSDYRLINFEGLKPFIDKYFAPSARVLERVAQLEQDYQIDYENTIGVFYRGNDKVKECSVAPYIDFKNKLDEIEELSNFADVLIQPDETECLEYFKEHCGTALKHPEQWLHMPKDTGASIFMKLPQNERPEHAINLLASVIMLSKCKHLITHTGNMSFWACLYRGNMNNVHQWRNGQWI